MNDYKKKVLNTMIQKITKKSKPKELLPYHERIRIWKEQILVFVLKHKLFDGNGFAEFSRKFLAGEIPKEDVNKINNAMRREQNERKKKT